VQPGSEGGAFVKASEFPVVRMAGLSVLTWCAFVALAGGAIAAETYNKAGADAAKPVTFGRDVAPILHDSGRTSLVPMSYR